MAFEAAEITADAHYVPLVSGQRRALVEQYYHALDWQQMTDVRKFLTVVEGVLFDLDSLAKEASSNTEYAAGVAQRIVTSLALDGWSLANGRFARTVADSHLAHLSSSATNLDAPELERQLERLRGSTDSDPALALGTAKELIETVCKTILEERQLPVDHDWDLTRLVRETRSALRLLPDDIHDSVKGAEAIKRVLGGLGSIAQNIAELRNLYGTGHGRSSKKRGIEPRHARLASGVAAALVTFLLETHWQRTE